METGKLRLRKDFKPLTTSCELVVLTPNSPVTQVYNSDINEWEPDREVGTGTILCPVCTVSVDDGSFPNGRVNDRLANVKWYVNGVDIATIPAWVGKYTVNNISNDPNKGSITIRRNIMPDVRETLRFTGVIADTRIGLNVEFSGDDTLSTHDKSDDTYSIAIDQDQVFVYNPFKDKLLEYDYKVANGILTGTASQLAAARTDTLDADAYEQTINVTVYKGKTALPNLGDLTLSLSKIVGGVITPITDSDYEIVSWNSKTVKIDLRLIDKQDYALILLNAGGDQLATYQFSFGREYPVLKADYASRSDFNPNQDSVYNKVILIANNDQVNYPTVPASIKWYIDTAAKKSVFINEGQDTVIYLDKAGVGNTDANNWMDIWTVNTQKGAYEVATDRGGDIYTDKGEILIFN